MPTEDKMAVYERRKTLIRLMKGNRTRQHRQKQRGRSYGPAVDNALRVVDESAAHVCAERLTPNLVWLAEHFARHRDKETAPCQHFHLA